MRKMKSFLGLTAIAAMLASPMAARAGSLAVIEIPGSPKTTAAITGFSTFGDMMVGMAITATFTSGSETVFWGATGIGAGGAFGTGWSLVQSGDTFTAPWTLTSTGASIVSLLIDGKPGRTVFDDSTPPVGTVGSASGTTFFIPGGAGAIPWDITTTYSDVLGLGMAAPVGDLYTKVLIEFGAPGGPFSGAAAPAVLSFVMDTDNATTDVVDVPEPASCTLLGIGAVGLLGYRARRRKLKAA